MSSAEECLRGLTTAAGRKLTDDEQVAFFERLRKAEGDIKAGRLSDAERALLGGKDEAIDAAAVAAKRFVDEADAFERQAHREILRAAAPKSPEVAELEAKLSAARRELEAAAIDAGVVPPSFDGAFIRQAESYDRAVHAVATCLQGKGS